MKMQALLLALTAAQAPDPHVIESWRVESTPPLRGADFLLIETAYRHPEMSGRSLACYHVVIFRERGIRTVAFLGDREPDRVVEKNGESEITIAGPNPRCPSRSFEMDDAGRVVRVIYERH